jgi:sulfite dehydrogenase
MNGAMKRVSAHWWLAILVTCSAPNLTAAPVKIELPTETAVFKAGPGVEIANGQCLTCHSVEYVATQPTLPRAFWASSVKKMREKYGAAIPEEQVERLLDYLTTHYGTATTNLALASVSNPGPKIMAQPVSDADAIATKYGCLGCHNLSVKIVGPPYREIADKYRGAADAQAKVREQIQKGGSGKWGPIIMPPFPQIPEAETKVLTEWILGQK